MSQIANLKLSRATALGGLSVNLNHLKTNIINVINWIGTHLHHIDLKLATATDLSCGHGSAAELSLDLDLILIN